MNPSTIVQTLVAAAMMRTIAGAIPGKKVFTTTVEGICLQMGWPTPDPGSTVIYYAGCSQGEAVAFFLKLIENPKNTFTLNLTDEQTATKYSRFIEEFNGATRTSCQTALNLENGDMEKIIYKPTPKNAETLETSIGSLQRTFTPGYCP
ncbi:hypothetical protein FOL46_005344 [Perkinsus olseni]|uniref:Uncharacterized protein n=1 Tax=Perkinsus olseni TaxID=32597 RepID=A0A7J6LTQ8_PEROL|nr:hypothetical protein FOL46_005344 [Perkinsus olseni]